MDIRVGNGYDTHPLVRGESLILGGINIPHAKGTKGHSDGDVLTHAIIDSLLGATSLGDIGKFFPSDDKKWENAKSKMFLIEVNKMLLQAGY